MASYTKLTNLQVFDVMTLLKEHVAPVEIAGVRYGSYNSGWSDERIAGAAGVPTAVKPVANLRRQMFGNFPPAPKAKGAVLDLLATLERRVATLEQQVSDLRAELVGRMILPTPVHPLGARIAKATGQ